MCGIVGIIGKTAVATQLVDALKRLEYRGYDSSGIATLEKGRLERRRAEGKLHNLETRLSQAPLSGLIGIGHTRWATHGRPTERNAHPHATKRLAVVHNGIIENFRELRSELEADGYAFETETDTEAVAQFVTRELDRGRTPVDAVAAALARLKGAFALAFMFSGEEDLLIGARAGAPLAVGFGEGEMYLGSDALALAPFTDRIAFLEEGDWAVLNHEGAEFRDAEGNPVQRPVQRVATGPQLIDRGNHRHFMAKEIHEQPEVVGHTLARYLDLSELRVRLPEKLPFDFAKVSRLSISACGTSYYAGLVAKYWFERIARLPVDIDIASEFRYREPPLEEGGPRAFRLAIGRDRRHARFAPLREGEAAAQPVDRQCGDVFAGARERGGGAHHRRPRNRRRLDQGLHLPARGVRLPRARGRAWREAASTRRPRRSSSKPSTICRD